MSDFDFEELDRAVSGTLDKDDRGVDTRSVRSSLPLERSSAPEPRRSQGGRFMDVVHPSSDMRTANMTSATMVAPVAEDVTKPSVLSFEPGSDDNSGQSQPPLESPFLPDAKVEKRPLGTPDTDIIDSTNSFEGATAGVNDATSGVGGALGGTEGAVSGIEDTENPETLEALSALESLEVPEESETAETLVETPQIPMKPAPFADDEPNGAVSITQQYTEMPRDDEPSGAIYDTEAYHQPFAQPVKKSSGGKVFLWVLLLVVLGVGLGVGAYYLLPML